MKINKYLEAIIVTLLYLLCIYYWTLPLQANAMPYGEVDAASHYAIAEYTLSDDSSISELPFYIDRRYGKENKFKEHVLWYPPPYHSALTIAGILGGDSVTSIFFINAILSSLIILSVYFLVRRFYGFEAAIASAFLLIFSFRDITIYIWGQWPERMGFAYLPLILYTFYMYSESIKKGHENKIYFYTMILLLAINFFIHPMDFFHSIAALTLAILFIFMKDRKPFFKIRTVITGVILFILILGMFPYQTLSVFVRLETDQFDQEAAGDFSRLLHWFKPQTNNLGVNPSYFVYKYNVGPIWTVGLIILGILFLILRRNKKDLVFLAWLVSLYIMIHLDFIGKGRVHRSLSGTAHIFYPLMVIGTIYLISFIKNHKKFKYTKLAAVGILCITMYFSFGIGIISAIDAAYPDNTRLNSDQILLTKWLDGNVPEDSQLFHVGLTNQPKTRWLMMLSHRYIAENNYEKRINDTTHIIIDYSDSILIGDLNRLEGIQKIEEGLDQLEIVYNTDLIRVYKIGA